MSENNIMVKNKPNDEIPSTKPILSWQEKFPRWKEAMFLTSVAGMSMLFGFGTSVSMAKKQDPEGFDKGMTVSRRVESGASFAARALKWGTFYAVTGCGILFFTVWKLMGVKDLKEFRHKVGEFLPRLTKAEQEGRTEFANLTDLLQYIIDEDNKAKAEKQKTNVTAEHNLNDDALNVVNNVNINSNVKS